MIKGTERRKESQGEGLAKDLRLGQLGCARDKLKEAGPDCRGAEGHGKEPGLLSVRNHWRIMSRVTPGFAFH